MNFKSKKKILAAFSLLFLLLTLLPTKKAQAAGVDDVKNYPSLALPFFTVKLVPPANQPEGNNVNYFSLRVKPGMRQILEMYVASTTDKTQKITITPTNGVTAGGSINATAPDAPPDPSNKQPFTSFAFKKTVITLAPKEVKKVTMSFTLPQQPFEGVIIGGLFIQTSLTTKSNAGKANNKKASLQFINDYSMGIQVVMTESDKLVLADLKVKNIIPQSYQTVPAVGIKLQNPKMQYMDNLTLDAKITRLANKKDQHQRREVDYKFAPTSNFIYYVPWRADEKMEAGKYRLDLKAQAKQTHLGLTPAQKKRQVWTISKEFTITPAQANDINRKNPKYKPDYTQLLIIIAILAVIFILFLFGLVFVLGRRRKPPKKQ